MKSKSHRLVFSALLSGISFLFIYISSVVPTGSIALFALSTAVLCVIVLECGKGYGLISAIVVGLLGIMLVPNKLPVLAFCIFCGYYPVLKAQIEGLNKFFLEWILKISTFSIAMILGYYVSILLFMNMITHEIPFYLLGLIGLGIFIVYDLGLSFFIAFYQNRIAKYNKR